MANARIRPSDGEHWLMLQCFIKAREMNGTWLESSGTSGAGADQGLAGWSSIRGLASLRRQPAQGGREATPARVANEDWTH